MGKLRAEPTTDSLRKWNIWLAAIFVVQAGAILLLAVAKHFPVNASFLNVDSLQSTSTGTIVLAPATHHLFDINMVYFIVSLLLIAAVVHAAVATVWRERYEASLRAGVNCARWVEYALTTGIMLVAIAILAGMYDVVSLGLLFVLSLVLHGCCWLVETVYAKRREGSANWISYGLVVLVSGASWLAIAAYLAATNILGNGHIPTFVYWLVGSAFVYCCGLVALLYVESFYPAFRKKYFSIERYYLLFSIIVKTAIVWQIFAGVLKP